MKKETTKRTKATDPKVNDKTVSFVLNQNLLNALTSYAKEQERSTSWVIRKALEAYLKVK